MLELVAAFSLFSGGEFGRWFGIFIASLNAIGALLSIPAYPFWSLAIFALAIIIIYKLAEGPEGVAQRLSQEPATCCGRRPRGSGAFVASGPRPASGSAARAATRAPARAARRGRRRRPSGPAIRACVVEDDPEEADPEGQHPEPEADQPPDRRGAAAALAPTASLIPRKRMPRVWPASDQKPTR